MARFHNGSSVRQRRAMMTHCSRLAIILAACLSMLPCNAFICKSSIERFRRERALSQAPPIVAPHTGILRHSVLHQFHIGGEVIRTTFAGRLMPVIRKLRIGTSEAEEIVKNVLMITDWQDLVVLLALTYGSMPLARLTYNRLSEDKKVKDFESHRRYRIASLIKGIGQVAVSVYVVDVLCIAFRTLGFTFPSKWDMPGLYSKTAYSIFVLRRFLEFKTTALCKIYKVTPDAMGRVELLDRFASGIAVSLFALSMFDWLSVQMGTALKGLLAFGSVGTLAFTLASQGLVSQFISGLFLATSDKIYPGDDVEFGDGTKGKIIKLGWMQATVRGPDNSVVAIPNSKLSDQKITNLSRVRTSQVKQTLRFHYEDADKVPAVLESIKQEIRESCPRLITDGSRPFRCFWTNFNEDHLEVVVDCHFQIPLLGDPYHINRQRVLIAINKAVKANGLEFAKLYRTVPAGQQPVWRVVPRMYEVAVEDVKDTKEPSSDPVAMAEQEKD